MPKFNNGTLLNFVPYSYYLMFCEGRHIDTSQYPYLKYDYDPSQKTQALFAVFDIKNDMSKGHETSTVVITYKAVNSKSQHDIFVYAG